MHHKYIENLKEKEKEDRALREAVAGMNRGSLFSFRSFVLLAVAGGAAYWYHGNSTRPRPEPPPLSAAAEAPSTPSAAAAKPAIPEPTKSEPLGAAPLELEAAAYPPPTRSDYKAPSASQERALAEASKWVAPVPASLSAADYRPSAKVPALLELEAGGKLKQ